MALQDPRNFIFSSDYPIPYFVYYKVIPINLDRNQRYDYVDVAHTLGFIPLLSGYWSEYPDFRETNVFLPFDLMGTLEVLFDIRASKDTIHIMTEYTGSTNKTIYVKLWGFAPPDYMGDSSTVIDSSNFMFDTDYGYLGLAKSGYIPNGSGLTTIPHNLGYVPQCKIWTKYTSQGEEWVNVLVHTTYPFYEGGSMRPVGCWADKDNFYVRTMLNDPAYYHIYIGEGGTE